MRIALCISGQPKFYEKSYKYLLKNIISNFEHVDIFLHAWKGESDNEQNNILKLYNPKKYLFEKEKLHILNYPFKQSKSFPNNVFSMFYSIKKSNQLKEKYEKENNFKYDWVFRLRFDFAINKFFNEEVLRELNNNLIYLNNFEKYGNPHCADCFAFSGSHQMNVYSNTYDNILLYGKEGIVLAGEAMLYKQLLKNNIKLKKFDINHAFEPDYKTCWCRHSLIRN